MDNAPPQSDHDVNFQRQKPLPPFIPRKQGTQSVPRPNHRVEWELILQIGYQDAPFVHLTLVCESIVGRADPSEGFIPQIDLTTFGAKETGISRRHAVLSPNAEGVSLLDLGSINGTSLNDSLLLPNQPYKLQVGDEILLGALPVGIRALHLLPQTQNAAETLL